MSKGTMKFCSTLMLQRNLMHFVVYIKAISTGVLASGFLVTLCTALIAYSTFGICFSFFPIVLVRTTQLHSFLK